MANILIADDDRLVRTTIAAILTAAGHSVAAVADGEACLQRLRAGLPDLVVLDIIMPERDGIDTIRVIRESWPRLPIVALSGGGRLRRTDVLQVAAEYGADLVLAKPFENADLVEGVRRLLARDPRA
ncbi:MAG TPA: response regulator [Alphaproteobacteria bacterium]|nr:response regulator [Alphaproteobacteria bacterium]